MSTKPQKPKLICVCAKCGSGDVARDATAKWSVDLQAWELAGTQDATWCERCEGEVCDTEEVELRALVDVFLQHKAPGFVITVCTPDIPALKALIEGNPNVADVTYRGLEGGLSEEVDYFLPQELEKLQMRLQGGSTDA